MLNTTNYSMTSQFSVLISFISFLYHFFFNREKAIIIFTNQIFTYILIFFLIIILLGQIFYRSIDEENVIQSVIEIIKLSVSFGLYSFLPYFFNKYLLKNNNNNLLSTNISNDNQNEEEEIFNDNSLQSVVISNGDESDQMYSNSFNSISEDNTSVKDHFDELQISLIIHLFELIIYFPFAYLNEEKGQISDLIIRIFLLKRKNMLLTSFFTFYLGYKYFIHLLRKISPSSIELIWFYFAFFGSIFGLTYGRDYMAATNPEKILRILGLFIIIAIILIKSISPPFPSYLSYYDSSLQQNMPCYLFVEKDHKSNRYQYLSDHDLIKES